MAARVALRDEHTASPALVAQGMTGGTDALFLRTAAQLGTAVFLQGGVGQGAQPGHEAGFVRAVAVAVATASVLGAVTASVGSRLGGTDDRRVAARSLRAAPTLRPELDVHEMARGQGLVDAELVVGDGRRRSAAGSIVVVTYKRASLFVHADDLNYDPYIEHYDNGGWNNQGKGGIYSLHDR